MAGVEKEHYCVQKFTWTNFSRTLARTHNLETALWLFTTVGSPPLSKGKSIGRLPNAWNLAVVEKLRLKIWVRGLAVKSAADFGKKGASLSGPADLAGSRCSRALWTSITSSRTRLKVWTRGFIEGGDEQTICSSWGLIESGRKDPTEKKRTPRRLNVYWRS